MKFEVAIDTSSRVDIFVYDLNLYIEVKVGLAWNKNEIDDQLSKYRHILGKDYTVLGCHPNGRFGLFSLSDLNAWIESQGNSKSLTIGGTILNQEPTYNENEIYLELIQRLKSVEKEINRLDTLRTQKLKNSEHIKTVAESRYNDEIAQSKKIADETNVILNMS